jgi:hypothetical protein
MIDPAFLLRVLGGAAPAGEDEPFGTLSVGASAGEDRSPEHGILPGMFRLLFLSA